MFFNFTFSLSIMVIFPFKIRNGYMLATWGKEALIQEGDHINVGAGLACPLCTHFPNSFTNNRLRWGHHNTNQVRKPKLTKILLVFTTLTPPISDPTCLHFVLHDNHAHCVLHIQSQKGLAVKHH
jgi:hypothetical protein